MTYTAVARACAVLSAILGAQGRDAVGRNSPDYLAALREQVAHSPVFQEKLTALCKGAADAGPCVARAQGMLFCRLLTRARPQTDEAQCASAADKQAPDVALAQTQAVESAETTPVK